MKSWLLHGSISIALAGLVLLCLGRVLANDFINLDDPTYVTQNANVFYGLTWPALEWAWTTRHAGFWIPLTWMSLELDASIYKLAVFGPSAAAWGFHLTNLLLHIINTLLVYRLIYRLTGTIGCSALVAALFGIHPLRVESVAWVTERKDLLSSLFGLLALLAYVRYREKPGLGHMVLVALFFAMSLMAKPVMVALPAIMLLLDWWMFADTPSGSDAPSKTRLLLEKLPLFGLSLLCTVITIQATSAERGVANMQQISPAVRLANALVSYQSYLAKTFWPTNLAVFYPHPAVYQQPGDPLSSGKMGVAMLILLGITAAALAMRKAAPAVLVGWLWFLIALLPNIGLIQAGNQAMADRFGYFALLGLFLALVFAGDFLAELLRLPDIAKIGLAVAVLAALGSAASVQTGYWRNSETLYTHALEVNPNNPYIEGFLGHYYFTQKDFDQAEKHLGNMMAAKQTSLPEFQYAYGHLLLRRAGRTEVTDPAILKVAAHHLSRAILLNPEYADAYHDLAIVQIGLEKCAEAQQTIRLALAKAASLEIRSKWRSDLETLLLSICGKGVDP